MCIAILKRKSYFIIRNIGNKNKKKNKNLFHSFSCMFSKLLKIHDTQHGTCAFGEVEYQFFSIEVLIPFSDSIPGAVLTCLTFVHGYT